MFAFEEYSMNWLLFSFEFERIFRDIKTRLIDSVPVDTNANASNNRASGGNVNVGAGGGETKSGCC